MEDWHGIWSCRRTPGQDATVCWCAEISIREKLASVANGVTISGVRYEPVRIEIEKDDESGTKHWLAVTIHEGKNREVRKIMAHLGLQVTRLVRGVRAVLIGQAAPAGVSKRYHSASFRESLKKYFSEKDGQEIGGGPSEARDRGKGHDRRPRP